MNAHYQVVKMEDSPFLYGFLESRTQELLDTFYDKASGTAVIENYVLHQEIIPPYQGLELFFVVQSLPLEIATNISPLERIELQRYIDSARERLQDLVVAIERDLPHTYRDIFIFIHSTYPYYGCLYENAQKRIFYSKNEASVLIQKYDKETQDRLRHVLRKRFFPSSSYITHMANRLYEQGRN